jgi:hypothetical protein
MKIKGKIQEIMSPVEGESAKGPWKKQEFILLSDEKHPRQIRFSLWNDNIDQIQLIKGKEVEVYFNLSSRKYKERWYTEARAWKLEYRLEIVQGIDESPLDDENPFLDDNTTEDLPFF